MSAVSHSDATIYRRLLRQARPYWAHLLGIFGLSLIATPLALLMPLPLKLVVDSVIGSQPFPVFLSRIFPQSWLSSSLAMLTVAASLLVLTTVASGLTSLASYLLQMYTGEKLVLDFRALLFRHVQRLSLSYHDMKGTADSTYRIQYDAPAIQYILVYGVIPLVSAISTLASMIYVTMRLDWQLSLVALTISPLLLTMTKVFARRLRAKWTDYKRVDSKANSIVQEVLSSVRVVKAYGREDHEQHRFMEESTRRMRKLLDTSMLQGGYDLLISAVIAAGTAAVLFVGARHVAAGILTLGELLLIIGYIAQLYSPLQTVSKKLGDLQGGLASAERAYALLNELPDVAEKPHARSIRRARGEVGFQNVGFGYTPEQVILSAVDLNVPAGTRVGIQGRTGAGKSTLMSLLMRFYDVSSGRILLDGEDLREYKVADLRNQFAIVLQDTVLFSTTIAENIAYARPDASQADIIAAAQLANAHAFISALPDGYDTRVGERGMRLSGGERQRISLARAFLKDSPILVLDEPTSSVDTHTETQIMDAMERLMQGRTTFLIAHRLSTLEHCDMRLEIRDGRLLNVTDSADAGVEVAVQPPNSADV